jgi:Flp pilus assembly protein TadD
LNPEFARLYNQGLMLERSGRTAEAVEVFRQALEIHPGDIDAQIHLGLILRDLGRDDEANRAFLAALDIQRRVKVQPVARGRNLSLDFAP